MIVLVFPIIWREHIIPVIIFINTIVTINGIIILCVCSLSVDIHNFVVSHRRTTLFLEKVNNLFCIRKDEIIIAPTTLALHLRKITGHIWPRESGNVSFRFNGEVGHGIKDSSNRVFFLLE